MRNTAYKNGGQHCCGYSHNFSKQKIIKGNETNFNNQFFISKMILEKHGFL